MCNLKLSRILVKSFIVSACSASNCCSFFMPKLNSCGIKKCSSLSRIFYYQNGVNSLRFGPDKLLTSVVLCHVLVMKRNRLVFPIYQRSFPVQIGLLQLILKMSTSADNHRNSKKNGFEEMTSIIRFLVEIVYPQKHALIIH